MNPRAKVRHPLNPALLLVLTVKLFLTDVYAAMENPPKCRSISLYFTRHG
jgi:hypothetical protein